MEREQCQESSPLLQSQPPTPVNLHHSQELSGATCCSWWWKGHCRVKVSLCCVCTINGLPLKRSNPTSSLPPLLRQIRWFSCCATRTASQNISTSNCRREGITFKENGNSRLSKGPLTSRTWIGMWLVGCWGDEVLMTSSNYFKRSQTIYLMNSEGDCESFWGISSLGKNNKCLVN